MISYKGFQVWICDPSTYENIAYIGRCEYAIVSCENAPPNLSNDSISSTITKYNNFTTHRNTITNCRPTLTGQDDAINGLQELFPATIELPTIFSSYSGKKLKLIAANGNYAISQANLSSVAQLRNWYLYTPDNTLAGAFAFSVMYRKNACYGFGAINGFTGTVPNSGTFYDVHGYVQNSPVRVYGGSDNTILDNNKAAWWNGITPLIPPSTDPYGELPTGGDDPIPGGGAVSVPGFPGLTATSAGVIGLFCPSAAQMQLLSDFMWTDFGGTGTTVEDILKELVEAVKRTISNPLDYIIGLNIIPSQGLTIGSTKNVRFGFIDSGVSMPILANQYFTVDCGALTFDTLCGDTFLDYAPYSKFSIYLPYIGFKDVDPNDFVGHTIGVVYHGDCVTGGVTAYVTKDGSVMYQYSGCCALNVPLSADSWGETISGTISVATGIVAAAASGGAAGVGLAAAKGAASVAANPSLLSPQVSHSGAVSGGAGCMGVQYPFVIREAVNFHSTEYFNKETGYPAYYYKKFDDIAGYTTVLDPHIGNIENATREELNEIETLLESGVIF